MITSTLTREKQRETQREERQRVVWLPAKECQQSPEDRRGSQRECNPDDTFVLDFWSPKLGE